MPTFQELAADYAKRIRAGSPAKDIADAIAGLVYISSESPLSDDDKAKIARLVKDHFTNEAAVPGQPGLVYIRDSDNRAYLALVSQLYALLGVK